MADKRDVERLMLGYAAFGSGDVETVFALLDPDVVVEAHTERPDIGRRLYHGHEGFVANFSELTDVFDDLRIEPCEIEEHGDRVLMVCRLTGRGKSSGAGFDTKIFHVWTLHDGVASRLDVYSDGDQARAALS